MVNKKTIEHGMLTFRPTLDEWTSHCMNIDFASYFDWKSFFKNYTIVLEENNHLHVSFDLLDENIGLDAQHFRRKFVWKLDDLCPMVNTRRAVNMKWSDTPFVYHRYTSKNIDQWDCPESGYKLIETTYSRAELEKYCEEYRVFNNGKRLQYQYLDFQEYVEECSRTLNEEIYMDLNDGNYNITFLSMEDLIDFTYVNMLKKKCIYRGNALLKKSALEQFCYIFALEHYGIVLNMPI